MSHPAYKKYIKTNKKDAELHQVGAREGALLNRSEKRSIPPEEINAGKCDN